MTTQPNAPAEVDVLAVMDDVADRLDRLCKDVLYRPSVAAPQLRKARTAVAALIARNAGLEAENAHLAAFFGPSAMPRLRASLASGLPAGGADQPIARIPAPTGEAA